jgi:hypothetical protein
MKKYYLQNAMQFMIPFIKTREETKGNLLSPPTPEDINGNTAAGGDSQERDGNVEFPEDEAREGSTN